MDKSVHGLIGKRSVEALTPHASGATRVLLWDDKLAGFGVRVSPSGRKTYIVKYEWRGKDQTYTIGEHGSPWTAKTARVKAATVLAQAREGQDPSIARASRRTALTVSDLIEKWLTDGPVSRPGKRPWSWKTDASRLRRHAAPLIGRLLARDVKRRDIEHMQAEIARGATADKTRRKGRGRVRSTGGPFVAANVVQSVSAMYGWAWDQEFVEHNPCLRVKRVSREKRVRFLSKDETKRLLASIDELERSKQLNDAHAACLRLLLLTGARKGEITGLNWSEINWDLTCIVLPIVRSKTGARDPIRLAAPAIEILRERFEKRDPVNPLVFPSVQNAARAATAVDMGWKKVRAHAKLEGVRLHDLRHNAASVAVNEGVSLFLTGKLLGHRNATTTERYAHAANDPVQKAAELVAARIMSYGAASAAPKPTGPGVTALWSSQTYRVMIRTGEDS